MDRQDTYRKRGLFYHEITVVEGRVVYTFYALTKRGVHRKVRKYWDHE